MIADSSAPSWIVRRPARWSMPVCLQPLAARRCRIVRAKDKRPVRLSRLGYHVRPGGHYQLEVELAEESSEPRFVSVAGPMRCTSGQEQRLAQDGRTLSRYDLRFARRDEGERVSRWSWSRLEPLAVRLEYGDGRDDGGHTLRLAVRPRRLWVLLALIGSAVLYGIVPWLSRTILEAGDLPAACSRVLHVLARPAVWQGFMLAIFGFWLIVLVSDRLQLWLCSAKLRRAARREVEHYTELAQRPPSGL